MTFSKNFRVAVAALGVLMLSLTACGSDELPSGSTSTAPTTQSTVSITGTKDEALAAKVPDKFKSKGVLVDGTDGSYEPNESVGKDGKTLEGMSIDLLNAVATTIGLKVEYNNANFDTILLGVTSGKYDIAISSFTINDERKKQVEMVQYFNAGTSWATTKGSGLDPNNACGKKIAVQKGTVQVDDLDARSKKCVADGKPAITAVVHEKQSRVNADLAAGSVDGMLADSPIVAYAVKLSEGKFEIVGELYDAAPYGILVGKDNPELAKVISEALAKLKADGTYEAILAKWGVQDGAVKEFPVNP